jgi:hypothetical protein
MSNMQADTTRARDRASEATDTSAINLRPESTRILAHTEPQIDSGSRNSMIAIPNEIYPSVTSYESVKAILCNLPRNCSEVTRAENLALIGRLGRRHNVIAVLRHILDHQPLLREIAGCSYRHTNHFDKIVLLDSGSQLGYRLTMHLWIPPYSEQEANDEQIHDHRFSFWSAILVGKIVFQDYARDASGVVFNEYQYIPEKLNVSTVGNFYIDVGESPLLETGRSGGMAGEFYYLPYSRIHRVVLPSADMSCTLVLRGPRQKNYASVFSNSRKYNPSANVMFSPRALAGKLSMVLDEIEGTNH